MFNSAITDLLSGMDHSVYISYTTGDKLVADAVCGGLEARGIRCWMFPRDVMPNENYVKSLKDAIDTTKIVVVVFSSKSNQSPSVMTEIEQAFRQGKRIIIFRVDDIQPSGEVQYFIGSHHWFDAFNRPLEKSIDELVRTIVLFTKHKSRQIVLSFQNTSICSVTSDVAILWYNPEIQDGTDKKVIEHMQKGGIDISYKLSLSTDFLLVPSKGTIGSRFVLFMSVNSHQSPKGEEIRGFISRAIRILSEESFPIRHISLPLQGLTEGTDKIEILKADLAGLSDAVGSHQYPKQLESITLIEKDNVIFERVKKTLNAILPGGCIHETFDGQEVSVSQNTTRFERAKKAFQRLLPDGYIHRPRQSPQGTGNSLENSDSIEKDDRKILTPDSHTVFISYVEEDTELAQAFAQCLEKAGFSTWYYGRDSIPGPSYFDQVIQNIDNSRIIMVILSPHSLSSSQVYNEITYAHEKRKLFIPILKNLSHDEFQQRQPSWRMILGAYTSIRIPDSGVEQICERIVKGTEALLQQK